MTAGTGAGTGSDLPAGTVPAHDRWALGAVCAVLFLTFVDTTIVSVALSDVQSRLHAGVTQLQWVVNGYALTFASLMLIAGSLSDRFGRKRVMLLGLSIFAVGSLLGALAPNADTLIGARVVMGVGAAASEPGTLSVIRHLYPDSGDRARALGAWAAVSGLALALGPVIGGALVGIGTFRAIFWFNVVAAAAVITVAAVAVPESADPQSARLDLPGFATAAIGLGALSFAIILEETAGLRSAVVVVLFAVGVLSLVGFTRVERASRAPILDLSYFREAPFSGSLAVVFVLFFGIFSIFFFTALYLSAVVGYGLPDRCRVPPDDRGDDRSRWPCWPAGRARGPSPADGGGVRARRCRDPPVGGPAERTATFALADGDHGSGGLRFRHERRACHLGFLGQRAARTLWDGGLRHQYRAGSWELFSASPCSAISSTPTSLRTSRTASRRSRFRRTSSRSSSTGSKRARHRPASTAGAAADPFTTRSSKLRTQLFVLASKWR